VARGQSTTCFLRGIPRVAEASGAQANRFPPCARLGPYMMDTHIVTIVVSVRQRGGGGRRIAEENAGHTVNHH